MNVLVAALLSGSGASRAVLRLCLRRKCQLILGEKLFQEFSYVVRRPVMERTPVSMDGRSVLVEAFVSVCEWVPIFFLWRPNLTDEGDNHLIELGVAGMAQIVVTQNTRDFRDGEFRFPQMRIESLAEFVRRWRKNHGNNHDSDS
jgi:predicted nucleic acid-binding protein